MPPIHTLRIRKIRPILKRLQEKMLSAGDQEAWEAHERFRKATGHAPTDVEWGEAIGVDRQHARVYRKRLWGKGKKVKKSDPS